MKKTVLIISSLFAAAMVSAPALAADTIVYNTAPADGWFYGTGNDYVPANTAVLTADNNSQLYLRMHQTFAPASASDAAGIYSFALGTSFVSFDWGIDNTTPTRNVNALLTFTNIGTGATFSYDPFGAGNDNSKGSGSTQNSNRLNFLPIGFDPNVNDTYRIDLTTTHAAGADDVGTHLLTVFAQIGTGAVPEPATWAMMLMGFGMMGAGMRYRTRKAVKITYA